MEQLPSDLRKECIFQLDNRVNTLPKPIVTRLLRHGAISITRLCLQNLWVDIQELPSLLQTAACRNYHTVVEELFHQHGVLTFKSVDILKAIRLACANSSLTCAQLLLPHISARHAIVDIQNQYALLFALSESALIAIEKGCSDILELLIATLRCVDEMTDSHEWKTLRLAAVRKGGSLPSILRS